MEQQEPAWRLRVRLKLCPCDCGLIVSFPHEEQQENFTSHVPISLSQATGK